MLTERQNKILDIIIKEHTKTAEPVASDILVDKYKLDVSSATVRNEMLELDKQGFLEQPHTSSGRIPTEKAYHHSLTTSLPKEAAEHHKRALSDAYQIKSGRNERERVRVLAKSLAELSQEFVLAAFADNDFYYTGLRNLLSKPEFQHGGFIYNISLIVDHLDTHLAKLYHDVPDEATVLIGRENPIDAHLSLVTIKSEGNAPFLALLGPIRMEYRTNIALVEYCRALLVG